VKNLKIKNDIWVFAYGSLLWKPGFKYIDSKIGTLNGYHRDFCVKAHSHRGTPDRCGLVLSIIKGGTCQGILYKVKESNWDSVLDYLCQREMKTEPYLLKCLTVNCEDADVQAYSFIIDINSSHYIDNLNPEEKANIINKAHGCSGSNKEYFLKTLERLNEMDISEEKLNSIKNYL
jgi:cation transport protein ChaC